MKVIRRYRSNKSSYLQHIKDKRCNDTCNTSKDISQVKENEGNYKKGEGKSGNFYCRDFNSGKFESDRQKNSGEVEDE